MRNILPKVDFPYEHFGVADRFLLKQVISEEIKFRIERDMPLAHYGFIVAVCTDMQRRYGFKTKPSYSKFV